MLPETYIIYKLRFFIKAQTPENEECFFYPKGKIKRSAYHLKRSSHEISMTDRKTRIY